MVKNEFCVGDRVSPVDFYSFGPGEVIDIPDDESVTFKQDRSGKTFTLHWRQLLLLKKENA